MRRMRRWKGFPHILESQQFSASWLLWFFSLVEWVRRNPGRISRTLRNLVVAVCFYEPSSRTRISFAAAAEVLGARVKYLEEHMAIASSVVKGESLRDTVRTLRAFFADIFIIRWNVEGSVADATKALAGRLWAIINGGDGPGQHPTQALLDLYTIWRHFRRIWGKRRLTIGLVGDLKYGRTVHSLVYLLAKFPFFHFVFISPRSVRMKSDLIEHLREHNRSFEEHFDGLTPELVRRLDIVYMTRSQLERQKSARAKARMKQQYPKFWLTERLARLLPKWALILHPWPRNEELPEAIDRNPRARYIQQMRNGLWVRVTLLLIVAKLVWPKPPRRMWDESNDPFWLK